MNQFGGNWTENKIEILIEYAGAYLTIMNPYAIKNNWQLLYFDGFAGSGEITKGNNEDLKIIMGATGRILEIDTPRPFDMYYFVEKEKENFKLLKETTKDKFPNKIIHVVEDDCNTKIKALSKFMDNRREYRALAYIDPCGMQLDWESIQSLEKLNVDVWILIPTGMGVNRLLKKDGKISDAWISKLEIFLGMTKDEILNYFYNQTVVNTLFGEEVIVKKEDKTIEKSADLYKYRLNGLFKYVSNPYILKNKANSTMFHFLMASNNQTAVKVANDIVKKYNKQI